MLTKKILEKIEEKYGDMASIIIFSDWSGHIEDGNGEWMERFNNLQELKDLLQDPA